MGEISGTAFTAGTCFKPTDWFFYLGDEMSQTHEILEALKAGDKITPLDALQRFGCFRLAARIGEIQEAGYAVKSKMVKSGENRFAEYSL